MPKKRKRGAGLHCCIKHYRPGNAIIRIRNNGIEQNIKNYFTSTEPSANRDIGLFDVTEFEKESEELDKKKDHYFQQQQRIAIVFIYEHIFCEILECNWKRYNMVNNIMIFFVYVKKHIKWC